ncbi:hypothetical protein HU200_011459 [Digitaria exilis]|uniref:Reverse transcriptase zinc-binding domain-containing protein n=1 Tax=Digitaria exilis TaxID=1010633 RepID=A0A835FH60_9POAL|nr:hypothetical protein HU200_011459 [Digitaria exilis]
MIGDDRRLPNRRWVHYQGFPFEFMTRKLASRLRHRGGEQHEEEKRHRRGSRTDEAYCALCPSVEETDDHIFFECALARNTWECIAAVTPGFWAESYHSHHQFNMTQYFSAERLDLQPGVALAEKSSSACG